MAREYDRSKLVHRYIKAVNPRVYEVEICAECPPGRSLKVELNEAGVEDMHFVWEGDRKATLTFFRQAGSFADAIMSTTKQVDEAGARVISICGEVRQLPSDGGERAEKGQWE